MTLRSTIRGVGGHVPARVMTNDELAKLVDTSDEWIAQRTGILLLDEPTAALDLKHHEDVMRLIAEQARAGIAVAIVLHDLNAALAHADQVTLLSSGRVVASGPPAEVLTAERIEAVYGQPVDVFPHPVTRVPLVVARR